MDDMAGGRIEMLNVFIHILSYNSLMIHVKIRPSFHVYK